MRDAVIVEAVRTPVGKRNGGLSGIHSADLSAHVLEAIVERTGIDPVLVDDVIWGCVMQIGEQTFDIARTAVLSAGWPESVPGTTVDRQCGSSQQSVHFAAAGVISGQYDLAVAGGVEMMSRTPMGSTFTASPLGEKYTARYGSDFPNQGIGAEKIADQWGLSRHRSSTSTPCSPTSAPRPPRTPAPSRRRSRRSPPPTASISLDEGIRRGGTLETLGRPQAGLQGGRQDHRRQLLADLRRLRRPAHHHAASSPPPTASPRSPGSTPPSSSAPPRCRCSPPRSRRRRRRSPRAA